MFHQSRYLFLALVVAFGLHQATAAAQDAAGPLALTALQASSPDADIQLCSCTDANCCPMRSLLDRCGCRSRCGPTGCSDDGCGDGCGGNACCTPWTLVAYAGTSYFTLPMPAIRGYSSTAWGASEGVAVGYRVNGTAWGLYGSAAFNHTDDSTQILGTVGVQKFGIPCGDSVIDRTSMSILWDQFADLDYGPDSYIHQFRFNVGYVTSPRNEIGMTFSVPTSDDLGVAVLTPMGGAAVMPVADHYVGPYISRELASGTQLTATVGYTDAVDGDLAAGVGAAVPFTTNTDLFFNGKYGGEEAWAMMIGVEYKGGRADTKWY